MFVSHRRSYTSSPFCYHIVSHHTQRNHTLDLNNGILHFDCMGFSTIFSYSRTPFTEQPQTWMAYSFQHEKKSLESLLESTCPTRKSSKSGSVTVVRRHKKFLTSMFEIEVFCNRLVIHEIFSFYWFTHVIRFHLIVFLSQISKFVYVAVLKRALSWRVASYVRQYLLPPPQYCSSSSLQFLLPVFKKNSK